MKKILQENKGNVKKFRWVNSVIELFKVPLDVLLPFVTLVNNVLHPRYFKKKNLESKRPEFFSVLNYLKTYRYPTFLLKLII